MASEAKHYKHPAASPIQAAAGSIPLAQVDFSDTTYRITSRTDFTELVESIKRLGVLVPPLVRATADRLVIISGFLRLQACRQLGIETTIARVMPADAAALDCARCAVAENGLQRRLNPLETARAIALLAAVVPEEGLLTAEGAAAGLPSNREMIAKLMQVDKLPTVVQARLAEGTIGLAMALALGRHAPEFSCECAEIFGELRIGLNRQREILGLVSEIAARDGISPLGLIREDSIQEILANADLDRPQKVARIRDRLHRKRYPHLARAEETFTAHRQALKLGKHIQLTPPRFFEADTYTLSIQFRDIEGLQALLKRLDRISADPNLKLILSRSDARSA